MSSTGGRQNATLQVMVYYIINQSSTFTFSDSFSSFSSGTLAGGALSRASPLPLPRPPRPRLPDPRPRFLPSRGFAVGEASASASPVLVRVVESDETAVGCSGFAFVGHPSAFLSKSHSLLWILSNFRRALCSRVRLTVSCTFRICACRCRSAA